MLCTLLAAVVALGLINRLRLPRWAEIAVGVLLVGLAQRALVIRLFRTSFLAPDGVPPALYILFLAGEAFLFSGTLCTLLWWSLRLVRVRLAPIVPLGVALGLAVLMVVQGYRQPAVREHTVRLRDLPDEAEGLRVAVIADLHLDSLRTRTWCTRFVERVNALQPDLILFTGDQADGTLARRRDDLAPLAELRAPLGAYAVTGNHEWYFDTEAMLAYYRALGITPLDGQRATVRGITLLGVPDGRSLTQQNNVPILRALTADLPPEHCTLLLSHKPALAIEADALGVDLQLSGHTHGGQLPGVATLIARFNRGLVRGWYTLPRGLQLYVAPGSGVWCGFPFRLYPPELTILTLRRP